MSGRRAERREGHRLRLPDPPSLNYSVLAGTLLDDPRLTGTRSASRSRCRGSSSPLHSQMLLTRASCEVEVSDALTEQHGIRELEGGARVLAAGRLSERWRSSGAEAQSLRSAED